VARIDHFHDPDAPKAFSIVVAVTAFVLDDAGRVLLIRRTDNGLWALPAALRRSASRSSAWRSGRPARRLALRSR
jgi:hypothetical protein